MHYGTQPENHTSQDFDCCVVEVAGRTDRDARTHQKPVLSWDNLTPLGVGQIRQAHL